MGVNAVAVATHAKYTAIMLLICALRSILRRPPPCTFYFHGEIHQQATHLPPRTGAGKCTPSPPLSRWHVLVLLWYQEFGLLQTLHCVH